MCVFLCANPNVREWLEPPVDFACRKCLQLKPVMAGDLLWGNDAEEPGELVDAHGATRRVDMGGYLAMQIHTRGAVRLGAHSWRASSPYRHKPLDALAKAWSRLLLWVGWGR